MKISKETKLKDEELVAKIVATNDPDFLAELYDRYAEIIYNKCISFTHNSEEAKDITHDIFINLYLKIRTFKGKSKFSTWLYSFTYNFCVNYTTRKLNKRNKKFILTDEITDEQQHHLENTQEVEDETIYQMKSDKLQEALKKINPNDKVILLMKYQDDMSVKEIQEVLGIRSSAVKMRINRAKGRLLELYKAL